MQIYHASHLVQALSETQFTEEGTKLAPTITSLVPFIALTPVRCGSCDSEGADPMFADPDTCEDDHAWYVAQARPTFGDVMLVARLPDQDTLGEAFAFAQGWLRCAQPGHELPGEEYVHKGIKYIRIPPQQTTENEGADDV